MQGKQQYYIGCNIIFENEYNRSLGQLVSTQPTIGSNIEEICHNNVKFQAWDLGGQETMRTVWDAYYLNTDVITNSLT
jgi:ADP-ribosylation factor-like protein 5B